MHLSAKPVLVDVTVVVSRLSSGHFCARFAGNDAIHLTMKCQSRLAEMESVIITISSQGMLCSLMAFPRIISDSLLEYTSAVSNTLIPWSYLVGLS